MTRRRLRLSTLLLRVVFWYSCCSIGYSSEGTPLRFRVQAIVFVVLSCTQGDLMDTCLKPSRSIGCWNCRISTACSSSSSLLMFLHGQICDFVVVFVPDSMANQGEMSGRPVLYWAFYCALCVTGSGLLALQKKPRSG